MIRTACRAALRLGAQGSFVIALVACGSDASNPAVTPSADAGSDVNDAATDPKSEHVPQEDSGPTIKCKLDQGGDPVGLCEQKFVLQAWHDAAYKSAAGVAESWDSTTFVPDQDGQGNLLHDARDDVAYGASLASYYQSAKVYGDNELDAMIAGDLKELVPLIDAELGTLPDDYDGELYVNLRAMAGGVRARNDLDSASKLDAIADKYARAVFDVHYKALPEAPSDGGVPDAEDAAEGGGTDGDADGDAAGEVVTGNAIIGKAVGDQVQYESASVASAALALADMAWRHPDDTNAAEWQRAAVRAWMHLWQHAREPSSGMLYRTMITTAAGVDELSGEAPNDVLLIDVQATVALSMLRAVELVNAHGSELAIVATWPLLSGAQDLVGRANEAGLWDAELGGYYEGVVASSQQKLTDKTTRGNGRMLMAVHRSAVEGSSAYAGQMTTLRTLLMQRYPMNTSLLSALDGQVGYFIAVARDYKMEGLEAGTPRYLSYFSRANGWGCEALGDGWYGIPH
jgi:hypothetical protein